MFPFLGDSGYPLLPYLMTPKLNEPPGSPGAVYTDAHVRARCSVERTIGVLKWRCLRKERGLHYFPEFVGTVIYLYILFKKLKLNKYKKY